MFKSIQAHKIAANSCLFANVICKLLFRSNHEYTIKHLINYLSLINLGILFQFNIHFNPQVLTSYDYAPIL